MDFQGRSAHPAIGFAFIRVRDANETRGGIVIPGASGESKVFEVVESAPCWITSVGARVDVDYQPGDQLLLRPSKPVQDPRTGQRVGTEGPLVARPQIADWPADVYMCSLADVIAVVREVHA